MKSVYFLHSSNGACAIIHLDPDHQPVLWTSSHLVEELQTLELPLGIEDSGFQQGRLLRRPTHCAEVHEIPTIYKIRQNLCVNYILLTSFVLSELPINRV